MTRDCQVHSEETHRGAVIEGHEVTQTLQVSWGRHQLRGRERRRGRGRIQLLEHQHSRALWRQIFQRPHTQDSLPYLQSPSYNITVLYNTEDHGHEVGVCVHAVCMILHKGCM